MIVRDNSIEVFNRLKKLVALSFLVVGLFWLLYLSRHNDLHLDYILAGIGAVYIGIAGILFFLKFHSQIAAKFFLVMFTCNVAYLLIEACMFFYSGFVRDFRSANYFNKPCLRFDNVSGYRWEGDSCRVVRIGRGEIIFDQRFRINKQGYISHKD